MENVLLLPPNIASLTKLTSDTGYRYATHGVRIVQNNGTYRAEATDGRVLGLVTGKPDDPADYPTIDTLAASNHRATEAILPATEFAEAFKTVPKKRGPKPVLQNLAYVLGQAMSSFGSTNFENQVRVAQIRNLEGRFPPVNDIVPGEQPFFTIQVNPDLMVRLLQVAAKFCNEDKGVSLEFHGFNQPMVVKCKNETQEFTGILAPMNVDEQDKLALDTRDRFLKKAARSSVKATERIRKENA